MSVKFGEYKGSPTISLVEQDKDGQEKPFPFTFGIKKAKLILENIKDIEVFVNANANDNE